MPGGFGALLLRPEALPDANPPLFRAWDWLRGVLDCTPLRRWTLARLGLQCTHRSLAFHSFTGLLVGVVVAFDRELQKCHWCWRPWLWPGKCSQCGWLISEFPINHILVSISTQNQNVYCFENGYQMSTRLVQRRRLLQNNCMQNVCSNLKTNKCHSISLGFNNW